MKEMTMDTSEGEKIVIYWRTRNEETIRRIRERFGIPDYNTLNGRTPALLKPEDKALFDETERRGFFCYARTEWTFNGSTYSF